ncbi:MAG: 30S ribosomal protein S1 [Cyanobacteria bacterium SW_9_44_58]|nr:MAG: 30S ribosomal protein S1 [Cyanobacteria bacterium SW_9_44_58]
MVSQNATSNRDIGFTHEDFAVLLDEYDYHFNPGDIVPGVVFSVEPRGALIDIGAKTAAYIPIQEMSINRVEEPSEVLQPDETREFFILTDENEDGQLTLSIRRIEYMRAWERVRQLQAEDATVRSGVFATNRGGALVRIEGLRGFIPGSHISTRQPKEDLVAQELPLKFLEVDEERNRLVLSHRRALVERKMSGLKVGEVVIGSVRGIKPYGAFIDIGGVSGLLHISEISHDHIDTPSSVFDINDELKVMIIDLDAERGRISLSTKQLEPIAGAMLNNRQLVVDQADRMAQRFRRKLQLQTQGLASEDIEAQLNEEFGPIGQRPSEQESSESTEETATAESGEAETVTAETEAISEETAEAEAAVAEEETKETAAAENMAEEESPEATSTEENESSSVSEEEEIVSATNE